MSRKTPVVTGDARIEAGNGRERRMWWNYTAAYNEQGRLTAIQAVGRDITGRWQTEEALRQRNAWLEQINQASQTFVSSLDLDQVLARILETLRQHLNVTASSVWLTDEKTDELVCYYATEPSKKVVLGWRLAPGQGIAGWVARTGQSLIVPEVRRDPRHFRAVDDQTGLRVTSMISVPLRVKERVIGVIEVMDRTTNRFTPADLKYVEMLAAAASTAIENAHVYREANRLRAFNEDIVQSMDEGIMLENEAGIITFVNPRLARWLGMEAEAVVGRHWSDVLAPDQVLTMVAERNRWPRSVISRYETVLMTQAGEQIPVMVSARSRFREEPGARVEQLDHQSGGQYAGALSVFADIRELKRAEQAVEQRLAAEEPHRRHLDALHQHGAGRRRPRDRARPGGDGRLCRRGPRRDAPDRPRQRHERAALRVVCGGRAAGAAQLDEVVGGAALGAREGAVRGAGLRDARGRPAGGGSGRTGAAGGAGGPGGGIRAGGAGTAVGGPAGLSRAARRAHLVAG